MYQEIQKALEKPVIYTKTGVPFWDDEHISAQMLKAHLDPEFEGATRKLPFIDKSVEWISNTVLPSHSPSLLDVGCGPGIYAEKFTDAGYLVTGIDCSRRSIEYARQSALRRNLNIAYHCLDYLDRSLQLEKPYDFAVMIYCDYGALSAADRQIIMNNVFRQLKPGGKFLLDVFSMAAYEQFQEKQTWEVCRHGGFWRSQEYTALNGCYRYSECVTLEQTTVISADELEVYYLWNTYFSRQSLVAEASAAGFKVCGVYGDVAGRPYHKDEPTIAVLLEK